MNEVSGKPPTRRRKLFRAIGFVALLLALGFGWSWAWNRVAERVATETDRRIEALSRQGREIDCPGRSISGFPFRIEIRCESTGIEVPAAGFSAKAGQLRTAAQIYNPGHLIAEIDGPALVESGSAQPLRLDWEAMRLSLNANLDGLQRFSAQARAASVSDGWSDPPQVLARAANAEAHARPASAPDGKPAADLALTLEEAVIVGEAQLPPFSLAGDARIDMDPKALAAMRRPGDLRRAGGLAGELRLLQLQPKAGGSLSLSGPFQIDARGLLTGRFRVSASEAAGLVEFARAVFPQAADELGAALVVLQAAAGGGSANVTLDVDRGEMRAGFIRLGRIPPLF
jgi:hypothetical protein